jgi:hypothetical protein
MTDVEINLLVAEAELNVAALLKSFPASFKRARADDLRDAIKLLRDAALRPSAAPAAREVELPTNEQLELFAQKLVREKRLTWSGFRDDGTVPDRQNYTIPVISQSVGDLVRAALQSAASGREDSAMLDWLLSHPNEVFEEAGNEWFVLDADSTPTYFKSGRDAIDAAMNTTKGAEQ